MNFLRVEISYFQNKLSNLLIFSKNSSTKAVTYDNGPKMKRDASVKVVFFLPKKTTFTEGSLFIFGPWTYVMALVVFPIQVFGHVIKTLDGSGFSHPNFLDNSGFSHPNFFDNCVSTSFLYVL